MHAAVAAGGLAALSWEVLWQVESSLSLGISALGTAITLAATMAGMTAGALGVGAALRGREVPRPLALYGALELVIGASGLLMPYGFDLLERLDTHFYPRIPGLAPGLHALGIALLLGPPTFAMGATVPVFQLVARRYGVSVARLYGINTAGASLGVLLLSFAILPALGVIATTWLVASVNAGVFVAAAWIERGDARWAARGEVPVRGDRRLDPSFATALLVVFGTGFATFGLEVAWFRSLRAAFQSTTDSFALMLAGVLIPLAIAARLAPRLRSRGASLAPLLLGAGLLVLLATPLVERMDQFALVVRGSYWTFVVWRLVLSLAVLGPPMVLLGVALPWCLESFPDPERTGRLYGLNAVGAVSGSLAAAWWLLPSLGFARSAWLLGLGVVGLALRVAAGRARWGIAVAGAAALAVAASQTASLGRDRVQGSLSFLGVRILAFDEGPDSTVSVVETGNRLRMLVIDGFVASTDAVGGHYMQWMGRLPMLLHPAPRRALVICFGTGQTAAAVREEEPVEVDVVDVSRAVFEMAPLFDVNHAVLDDPRVRSIVMDGRAWIRRSPRRYDVVTLEPMPPTFAGVNALYSKEFYEFVARKLAPGGIVAQWVPFHLLAPDQAASVAATFQAVLPDALLWVDPISGTGILVGRLPGAGESLGREWPGLTRRAAPRTLSDGEIRSAVALDARSLARWAGSGSLITDDNQLLAYRLGSPDGYELSNQERSLENLRVLVRIAGHRLFLRPVSEDHPNRLRPRGPRRSGALSPGDQPRTR